MRCATLLVTSACKVVAGSRVVMAMKILLFGKNGQVGWELQRSLAPLGEILALDRHSSPHCGDLGQPTAVVETIHRWRPDVVVNAAAYTAVDKAEMEPEVAERINVQAPTAMADAATTLGAWFVHYSTDYVFDGSGGQFRKEDDVAAPLSVYGDTKLRGEHGVRAANRHHLIFRTSWVYSAHGSNFARTMLRLAQEQERLTVVDDQIGAPTGAALIADVTALALHEVTRYPPDTRQAGLYHLAAAGEASWHSYASYLIGAAVALRPDLLWKVKQIEAVTTQAFPTAAKRPKNSRLDTEKLRTAFNLYLPPWPQGVDHLLSEIL